jgi:hypothetical protein
MMSGRQAGRQGSEIKGPPKFPRKYLRPAIGPEQLLGLLSGTTNGLARCDCGSKEVYVQSALNYQIIALLRAVAEIAADKQTQQANFLSCCSSDGDGGAHVLQFLRRSHNRVILKAAASAT